MVHLPMMHVVTSCCSVWSVQMHVWLVAEHSVLLIASPRHDICRDEPVSNIPGPRKGLRRKGHLPHTWEV